MYVRMHIRMYWNCNQSIKPLVICIQLYRTAPLTIISWNLNLLPPPPLLEEISIFISIYKYSASEYIAQHISSCSFCLTEGTVHVLGLTDIVRDREHHDNNNSVSLRSGIQINWLNCWWQIWNTHTHKLETNSVHMYSWEIHNVWLSLYYTIIPSRLWQRPRGRNVLLVSVINSSVVAHQFAIGISSQCNYELVQQERTICMHCSAVL